MGRLSMLSTVGGALVAGALVYMVHASMRDQTHFMVTTMHAEADGLAEADDYDKSTGQRSHNATRSSFHPGPPSFWDEVKARWNSRLAQTLNGASMPAAPTQQRGASAPSDMHSIRDALAALAPHAPDAQPKFGIRHRVYGDPDTHYVGQGVSLR